MELRIEPRQFETEDNNIVDMWVIVKPKREMVTLENGKKTIATVDHELWVTKEQIIELGHIIEQTKI